MTALERIEKRADKKWLKFRIWLQHQSWKILYKPLWKLWKLTAPERRISYNNDVNHPPKETIIATPEPYYYPTSEGNYPQNNTTYGLSSQNYCTYYIPKPILQSLHPATRYGLCVNCNTINYNIKEDKCSKCYFSLDPEKKREIPAPKEEWRDYLKKSHTENIWTKLEDEKETYYERIQRLSEEDPGRSGSRI